MILTSKKKNTAVFYVYHFVCTSFRVDISTIVFFFHYNEKKSFANSSIRHKFCLRTSEKFENAKQSQCGDKLCDLFEECVLE